MLRIEYGKNEASRNQDIRYHCCSEDGTRPAISNQSPISCVVEHHPHSFTIANRPSAVAKSCSRRGIGLNLASNGDLDLRLLTRGNILNILASQLCSVYSVMCTCFHTSS